MSLETEEIEQFQKTYSFETSKEAKAFIKGANEAVGWQEVYVFDDFLHFG